MENEVTRDTSMNLSDLIKKAPDKKTEEENEVSPLDAALSHQEKGLVVETEELTEEEEKLRPNYDTDENRKGFSEKSDELLEDAKKAEAVVVMKKPENEGETAEMMDEISAVTFDENGKAVIPENARYIISKDDAKITKNVEETSTDEESNETVDSENTSDEDAEKNRIVQILIDKTGLGGNFELTEEEKKIVDESTEIRLTAVEDLSLKTATTKRDTDDDLSFMQTIDKYQLSVSKTHMIFPLSGFSADLGGLSYGEFADITLDIGDDSIDEYDFDKNWRMLSVIYDKMTNVSCGSFKSFEDFLKKFAWNDVPLAIYALLISTQPETDTLAMRCNEPKCKKSFTHKYNTRGLIDFKSCATGYLQSIDKVSNAKGNDRFKVAEESLVRTVKKTKLPDSGYVVEIGPASCWDYLYGICEAFTEFQNLTDEEKEERQEEFLKQAYYSTMLLTLRAIDVVDARGEWHRITTYEKIFEIFDKHMTPNDFNIVSAITTKGINEYKIGFSLKNIVCPHCGAVTNSIEIEPKELVFQIQQTMSNTQVTLKDFQLF